MAHFLPGVGSFTNTHNSSIDGWETTTKWYVDYEGDGRWKTYKVDTIGFGKVNRVNSCDGCKSFKDYGEMACMGCAG